MEIKHSTKLYLIFLLLILSVFSSDKGIVASTSWVGAIAEAAGADEVVVLAPFELRHPPEYDYRPQDVIKVLEADHIVWAGYEPFIKKLKTAYPEIEEKLVKVRTTNIPDNLVSMTRMLAEKFNTQKHQQNWEKRFLKEIDSFKERAFQGDVANKKVAVSIHQNEFITWLGFDVVYVFGQNQITPSDVAKILELNPEFIIDNYNSLDGKVLADNSQYVVLFNFPTKQYPGIIEVMQENMDRLGL